MITINLDNKIWTPPLDYILILQGMTENDYWELSSEDTKVEYSNGCLYIHSPASLRHEKIFGFLYRLINNYLEKNNLGEVLGSRVAILLPNGHRPEPDLVYFAPNSYDLKKDHIYTGIPEWIIEIVSKGTETHDFGDKLDWYCDAKIQEIWFLFQEETKLIRYTYNNKTTDYQKEIITKGIVSPLKFPYLKINLDWLIEFPAMN